MRIVEKLTALLGCLCALAGAGVGRFDSVDGTYDEQTGFAFGTTRYYQALTRTVIGPLSRSGGGKGAKVTGTDAGGQMQSIDKSAVIHTKTIKEGDMVRLTLTESVTGLPSYGDSDVNRGNYMAYQNAEIRVNEIDSPAIPVQGRMAQQRAAHSLKNIPGDIEDALINWAAQELEYEFLTACVAGASPSVLKATSAGGLGDTLGVKSLNTAGKPLCARHMYNQQSGWYTYSTTGATYNSTCNTNIAAITTGAAGYITLAGVDKVRSYLDTIPFRGTRFNGKQYKAVAGCDPEVWYRLNHLMATYYQAALPRGEDNKIFGVDHYLEYDDIAWISVPNLKKFRLSADGSNLVPSWGVGTGADVYHTDPRGYSTSSSYALVHFWGAGAMLQGVNERVRIESATAKFSKGVEYVAKIDNGFKRGEWFAQDGRTATTDCYCDSFATAVFYEPGVGTGW